MTLEGIVKNGKIRLVDSAILPEETKVYVVVPDGPPSLPGIWSPRLADRRQAADFVMEVSKSESDAGL
jgi:hypothetical protein